MSVAGVPASGTTCEEGVNETHARREGKGTGLGKSLFGELEEVRWGSPNGARAYWGVHFLFVYDEK